MNGSDLLHIHTLLPRDFGDAFDYQAERAAIGWLRRLEGVPTRGLSELAPWRSATVCDGGPMETLA